MRRADPRGSRVTGRVRCPLENVCRPSDAAPRGRHTPFQSLLMGGDVAADKSTWRRSQLCSLVLASAWVSCSACGYLPISSATCSSGTSTVRTAVSQTAAGSCSALTSSPGPRPEEAIDKGGAPPGLCGVLGGFDGALLGTLVEHPEPAFKMREPCPLDPSTSGCRDIPVVSLLKKAAECFRAVRVHRSYNGPAVGGFRLPAGLGITDRIGRQDLRPHP
jgi:hypothetical protein